MQPETLSLAVQAGAGSQGVSVLHVAVVSGLFTLGGAFITSLVAHLLDERRERQRSAREDQRSRQAWERQRVTQWRACLDTVAAFIGAAERYWAIRFIVNVLDMDGQVTYVGGPFPKTSTKEGVQTEAEARYDAFESTYRTAAHELESILGGTDDVWECAEETRVALGACYDVIPSANPSTKVPNDVGRVRASRRKLAGAINAML
jgi:hypothetical protein